MPSSLCISKRSESLPSSPTAAEQGEREAGQDADAHGEADADDPPVDLDGSPVGGAQEGVFVGRRLQELVGGGLRVAGVGKALGAVGDAVAHQLLFDAHHARRAQELALLAQRDQGVRCRGSRQDLHLGPPQGEVGGGRIYGAELQGHLMRRKNVAAERVSCTPISRVYRRSGNA